MALLPVLVVLGCAADPLASGRSGPERSEEEGAPPPAEGAPATADPKNQAKWKELLDFTRASIKADETPGAGIAIVLDGKLAFSGGVGVRSLRTQEPVTASTLFRVGSMSKMITAAAILSLADEQKLRLDDKAIAHVPDLALRAPHDPSSIKVEHLVFHTAALPDEFEWTCPTGPGELRRWFQTHTDYPLWAPPGTFFNYSNVGYSLLGLVAEMADARPFAEVVQKRVFDRAGMTSATFDVNAAAKVDHASLHAFQDPISGASSTTPKEHEITAFDCAYGAPAGNVIASPADFARFAETLFAGGTGMLKAESNEAMLRGHVPALGTTDGVLFAKDGSYGFGLTTHEYKGVTLVEHGGGYVGSVSAFWMVPEKKFAAACLSNGEGDPYAYCAKAADLFLDLTDQPVAPSLPNASTLALYEGTYVDPNDNLGTLTVSAQGSALSINMPAWEVTGPVQALGESSFFFPDPDAVGLTGAFFPKDGTEAKYFVTRSGVAVRR
jgi:CubicO group peptidase (beta-lactamase class C family)